MNNFIFFMLNKMLIKSLDCQVTAFIFESNWKHQIDVIIKTVIIQKYLELNKSKKLLLLLLLLLFLYLKKYEKKKIL